MAMIFFGVLSIVISLAGLVSYLLEKRKPRLRAHIVGVSLIDPHDISVKGLQVSLDGKSVESLTRTFFYIWNKGRKALRHDDIAKKKPLAIKWSSDVNVYSYELAKMNNEDTEVLIEPMINENQLKLDFDFLNRGDGFRVDIVHDSKSRDFTVDATIIDTKKSVELLLPPKPTEPLTKKTSRLLHRLVVSFMIILGIFGLTFLIFGLLQISGFNAPISGNYDEVLYPASTLLGVSFGYLVQILLRKKKHPENLDE